MRQFTRSNRQRDGHVGRGFTFPGTKSVFAKVLLSAGLIFAVFGLAMATAIERPVAASAAVRSAPPGLSHPDAACAQCHREIYDRYQQTSMARGSGLAREGSLEGQLRHAASGVTYKVFARNDALWMSYDRPRDVKRQEASAELHGERQLLYFIGSGHRGRTYLYQVDGQWFELPINFYGRREIWDMAPNFGSTTSMPAPLPVDTNCLHCHAGGVQTALPMAKNRWAGAPFEQGGIGCSGCHGDASKHLADGGHGRILNPDKLASAERDDVCLQCHLEGDAVVYRPGRSLAQFRPGDRLNDDAVYFVRASAEAGGRRATSQYEALLRSACKPGSGDRLTCTTCHDPHATPAPEQRVAFFRARCLSCHNSANIALEHHPEQQDCAGCHMPSRATTDISHEQVTDHNIQRLPQMSASHRVGHLSFGEALKPVGSAVAGDRELGLAYAQMAERGDREAGAKALALLSKAELNDASDAPLHAQLGYLAQVSGQRDRAAAEYRLALEQNGFEPSALGNLAVLEASAGRVGSAVSLLRHLVDADPAQTAAGLNLVYIECRVGMKQQAAEVLHQVEALNPDDPQVRMFLDKGMYAGQRCDLH